MAWPSQVGRYRITGELGRGAMGVVLRGIDPALERPVAIKLIAARAHSGVTSEEMEARFLREARVAARISLVAARKLFPLRRVLRAALNRLESR